MMHIYWQQSKFIFQHRIAKVYTGQFLVKIEKWQCTKQNGTQRNKYITYNLRSNNFYSIW